MVIDDLYTFSKTIAPKETDPPLVVDTDTMFSLAVPLQGLKPIRGRKSKILQPDSGIDRIESHERSLLNLSRELPHKLAFKNSFGIRITKRLNHAK